MIDRRRRWGRWWVYYLTEKGLTAHIPASWTDMGPKDPFVEQARGEAIARVEDLLKLAEITEAGVKGIKP